MPIALGLLVYFGYRLLTPTQRYRWASVLGLPVAAIIASVFVHAIMGPPLVEILFVLLVASLVSSFLMLLGLELRVRKERENGEVGQGDV